MHGSRDDLDIGLSFRLESSLYEIQAFARNGNDFAVRHLNFNFRRRDFQGDNRRHIGGNQSFLKRVGNVLFSCLGIADIDFCLWTR